MFRDLELESKLLRGRTCDTSRCDGKTEGVRGLRPRITDHDKV